MTRDEGIDCLPEEHAVALRMRQRGATDDAIAARLAVPVESVKIVINIAEAKLAAILNVAGEDP